MIKLLGASKTLTPAFALLAVMLTAGVIPAQGISADSNSVEVQVAHYESSASGGVLHSQFSKRV